MTAASTLVSDEAIRSLLPRLVANGLTPAERAEAREERESSADSSSPLVGDSAPVSRVFADYIDVVYLVPFSESGYLWANVGNLSAVGLSKDEAHKLALINLAGLAVDSLGMKQLAPSFGYFVSNFASSLILLGDEFWGQFDLDVNELVFACPVRDWLFFAPRDNNERVDKIASMIADFWNDPEVQDSHKLCDHLLQRGDGGSWSLLDVRQHLN